MSINGQTFIEWFVDEYYGGEAGIGNPNIIGFYIDDDWGSLRRGRCRRFRVPLYIPPLVRHAKQTGGRGCDAARRRQHERQRAERDERQRHGGHGPREGPAHNNIL